MHASYYNHGKTSDQLSIISILGVTKECGIYVVYYYSTDYQYSLSSSVICSHLHLHRNHNLQLRERCLKAADSSIVNEASTLSILKEFLQLIL